MNLDEDASYLNILSANRYWVERKNETEPDYFKLLAEDQNPEYLYIGCSDSRVHANEIMGLRPGQVFVHRNIANMMVNNDLNSLSVLHYAIVHLKVKYIIICGHYNCGGVKAAMEPKDLGIMNPWLRNIRDVYRLHEKELDIISDKEKRLDRLIELNVYEQCLNVIKTAEVQKSYYETGYPKIAGWVFDLKEGLLVDLKVDLDKELSRIKKIYDITKKSE